MFSQIIITSLLIGWGNQTPYLSDTDFTSYTLSYQQQIHSIQIPNDFYLNLNVSGDGAFNSTKSPFLAIEISAESNPEIPSGKYEIQENLITHDNKLINYYEDTQGELWEGIGCDIQAMCVYPELQKSIYQISCEGHRHELPMRQICQSFKLH